MQQITATVHKDRLGYSAPILLPLLFLNLLTHKLLNDQSHQLYLCLGHCLSWINEHVMVNQNKWRDEVRFLVYYNHGC